LKELFNIDWRDPTRYDFVINTSRISVETAARMIAEVSQREEYRPTEESLQAIKDLTVNARVQAVLTTSPDIRISNLELQTKYGEVYISGVLVGADLEKLIADTIKKVPGVMGIKTYFVVTPAEQYVYGDGR
jgi:osmotically-inducible protein OsmY